ncbi:hypothetical protein [Pseudomonas sp. PWP3-1b2]
MGAAKRAYAAVGAGLVSLFRGIYGVAAAESGAAPAVLGYDWRFPVDD